MSVIKKNVSCSLAFCALAAIWLFPLESLPSTNVLAQIFSATCIGLLGIFIPSRSPIRLIFIYLLIFSLLLLIIRSSPNYDANFFAITAAILVFISVTFGNGIFCNTNMLKVTVLAIVTAAVLSALAGLLQYFGLEDGLWPWVVEVLERGKALANLRQPNLLASLLCLGISATTWLVRQKVLSEGMAWVLIAILQVANVSTGSRIGGIESIALVGLGLLWGSTDRTMRRLFVGQFLVYLAAAPLVPWLASLHGIEARTLAGRFAASANDSRWVLWSNMIDLIRERPWFGWGWHEVGYAHFMLPSSPRFSELLDNAHNLPLHIAVVFGLPAATAIFGGLLWALVLAKPWLEKDPSRQFAWSVLILIGLHSLVEFPLWTVGFLSYAAISVGMLTSSDISARSTIPFWFSKIASLSLIIFCVLAWSQYQRVSNIYQISFKHAPQAKIQAIEVARSHWLGKWLFIGHVDYAELSTLTVSRDNARHVFDLSKKLLHFSAEPRVISAVITSAAYLQDWVSVDQYSSRFQVAFPEPYQRWRRSLKDNELAAIIQAHLPPE